MGLAVPERYADVPGVGGCRDGAVGAGDATGAVKVLFAAGPVGGARRAAGPRGGDLGGDLETLESGAGESYGAVRGASRGGGGPAGLG